MSLGNSRRILLAIVLWILCWSATYILLGFILVDHGFIAFVWPAYEMVVFVFHADPSGLFVRICVAVFAGLIWTPLPLGVVLRKPELIALPFIILFGNWFSGLLWGHAHVGTP